MVSEDQQRPRRPSHREAQQEALGAEASAERPNYWGLLPRLSAKVNVISLVRARPRTPLFTLMFRPPKEHAVIKLTSRVVSLKPPISLSLTFRGLLEGGRELEYLEGLVAAIEAKVDSGQVSPDRALAERLERLAGRLARLAERLRGRVASGGQATEVS